MTQHQCLNSRMQPRWMLSPLQNMSSARTTMPSSSPRFLGRKQAMARVLSSITSLPSPTTPHRRASLSARQPTTRNSTSPMSRWMLSWLRQVQCQARLASTQCRWNRLHTRLIPTMLPTQLSLPSLLTTRKQRAWHGLMLTLRRTILIGTSWRLTSLATLMVTANMKVSPSLMKTMLHMQFWMAQTQQGLLPRTRKWRKRAS